jgi:hypothetical protein
MRDDMEEPPPEEPDIAGRMSSTLRRSSIAFWSAALGAGDAMPGFCMEPAVAGRMSSVFRRSIAALSEAVCETAGSAIAEIAMAMTFLMTILIVNSVKVNVSPSGTNRPLSIELGVRSERV